MASPVRSQNSFAARLDRAGDNSLQQNPGGNILNRVGNGIWAAARTGGLAIATFEVGKETYHVARDMVNGSPTTWMGKAGESALGGVGEFLVAGGLAIATYNIALDTAVSAINGFDQVTAK